MIDLLINFALGCCGFLFYSLWSSKRYFTSDNDTWILSKFILNNYQQWIFNTLVIIFVCIVVYVAPEVFEEIKNLTGLELSDKTPGGFFTLGLLLNPLTKTSKTKTATTNEQKS